MSNRREVYFIISVILLTCTLVIGGCGKRATTTRIDEGIKQEMEVSKAEIEVEALSEPPVPRIEDAGELGLEGEPEREVARPRVIVEGVNDIYFDFDRYLIREDARTSLVGNASLLKGKQFRKIVIEGHCDERGTAEYNLALGERRADAARRYLVSLGIDPSKVSIISFGKEKPFCREHNEACWQQNRRAHFIVTE